MLSWLVLAAAQAAQPAAPMLATELIDRPAATAPADFVDRLAREAGAGAWSRSQHDGTQNGFAFRIVGLASEDGAIAFILPLAQTAGAPGRVCRITRLREGVPGDEETQRAILACLLGIGMPPADPALQPLPPPRS